MREIERDKERKGYRDYWIGGGGGREGGGGGGRERETG